ncbi:CBU_0592 family membrane protein [Shimia haliotis]
MIRQYPDILQKVGVFGFSLYILAFTCLQTGKVCGNSALYTGLVVCAASCVLISLASAFNLAAFLIQSSYVLIGVFGLARRFAKWRSDRAAARASPFPRRVVNSGL